MILESLPLTHTDTTINNVALYIAIDTSGSMGYLASNGETKLTNLKTALNAALTNLKTSLVGTMDITAVSWSSSVKTTITRRSIDSADIDDIITWVNGLTVLGGTEFDKAVSSAPAYFTASDSGMVRVIMFITDGEPSPASSVPPAIVIIESIDNVYVYAFNIELASTTYTAQIDNTEGDGVPVVTGGNPDAIQGVIESILESVSTTTTPGVVVSDLWPERDQYPQGLLVDPTIRSGLEQSKSLYHSGDQPLYRTWSCVLRHLTPAKKVELEELQELVGIGAEPMYYTDDRPESSAGAGGGSHDTYTVLLAQPMTFDTDDDGTAYRTEIFMIEYAG